MTDLISLTFEDFDIRAVLHDGNPWWVAADVATILGYEHTPSMVRNLDDDESAVHILHSSGQRREMTIISESGLYAAILKSRKPEAKRFRRWVTGEVLPALRQHGHYSLTAPRGSTSITEFDSSRLSASVAAVREARRLFGQQSARIVWMKLGLPVPIQDSDQTLEGDPMASGLEQYLDRVGETTIDDAAAAIGLGTPDGSTRLRIGQLLRLFGWYPRKKRVNGTPVNLFTPQSAATPVRENGDDA